MGIKVSSLLFWFSASAVALLSIAVLYVFSTHTTSTTTLNSYARLGGFELAFLIRVMKQSGLEDLVSVSLGAKKDCDKKIWKSGLISHYGVSRVLTVHKEGCGQFTSVQKAVDAVPDFRSDKTLIIINSGTYREKVVVSAKKTNVILQGKGYVNTAIAWNDTATSSGGTFYSYSVAIFADCFTAYDISFRNYARAPLPGAVGAQAVALRVSGDRAAFYNCGMYGAQDTLHDDQGRHYYKGCFIEGSIDFIFGSARSLYQGCVLRSIAIGRSGGVNGAITAQGKSSPHQGSGFSFLFCVVRGSGKVLLGRAWGPYATVVFAKTYMSNVVASDGWDNWGDSSRQSKVFFGEYDCMGPGANFAGRVSYGKQLKQSEAAAYMDISYIDGDQWLLSTSLNQQPSLPAVDHLLDSESF